MNSKWKFVRAVIDGEKFELSGINIWDRQWISENEFVKVKDPIYGESHTMTVYRIIADNMEIKFAAGEFSNMVWGIYQEQP